MADTSQHAARTSETVEREIAHTRSELDDTLDVLSNRLSPHEIKERAVDYAKDTATSVGAAVSERPYRAAAAVSLLTAFLWIRHRRARRLHDEQEELSRAVWERIAAALDRPANGFPRAHATLSSAADRLGGLALDARDTVSHAVGKATARTRDLIDGDAARTFADAVRRTVTTIEHRSREHPLIAIGIAAALSGVIFTRIARH